MKYLGMKYLFTIQFLLYVFVLQAQKLVVYDVPKEYLYSAHNDDFTVLVRVPGEEWQDLYEYKVEVDMDTRSKASMVYFDFTGKVDVMVKVNNGLVSQAKIRPASLSLQPKIQGNLITFSLEKPTKLSLEVNGEKLRNLHIFANSIDQTPPDFNDPDLIYFGPGVHQPGDAPRNVYHIKSGKTVYVHGGAIVKAKFLIDSAEDVKILGRGIVMQPERGVEIRHSKNITVDGLIFINPKHYTIYAGQSKNIIVRNIKSFSSSGWTDGIDMMSCSDVEIDDVFMRNSDDCIAIYGHRWDFYGSARNYKVTNSTLWADIAHPINIGLHGNANYEGDTIENIVFSNIDILEHDEDDRNYQGCFSIVASDKNLVRNVTYDDIRIDDIQEGQIFNIRVLYNEKYSAAPGRGIENIHFKNITYNGAYVNPSIIHGFDKDRKIKGLTFENVRFNGTKLLSADPEYIQIGDHVEGVKFKK